MPERRRGLGPEDLRGAFDTAFGEAWTPPPASKADIGLAEQSIKAYVDERDKATEDRIKTWVMRATLTQVLALIPVIFFLGGIYQTNNAALEVVKGQQIELSKRSEWMKQRERWEYEIELWARSQGFVPADRAELRLEAGNDS